MVDQPLEQLQQGLGESHTLTFREEADAETLALAAKADLVLVCRCRSLTAATTWPAAGAFNLRPSYCPWLNRWGSRSPVSSHPRRLQHR